MSVCERVIGVALVGLMMRICQHDNHDDADIPFLDHNDDD